MNKNLIKTVARRFAAAAACILITMNAAAQLKQFSLEDLNFGGTNYHNMIPEYRNITWWGDELVLRNAEECKLVNKANGKETTLFTEAQLNAWAKTNEDSKILNLGWAQFPYAGKSLGEKISRNRHGLDADGNPLPDPSGDTLNNEEAKG